MKMWIRNPFAFAALVAAVSLAACGDGSDPTGGNGNGNPPPQSGLVEIELTDGLRFEPDEVTIEPGTTVRWITVSENAPHTVTPRDDEQPGVWDRQEMPIGAPAFEHTFTIADEVYDYFCEPHEGDDMFGTITVAEE